MESLEVSGCAHILTVTAPQPMADLHNQQLGPTPAHSTQMLPPCLPPPTGPACFSLLTHVSFPSQAPLVGFLHGSIIISCPLQPLPGFHFHPHLAVFALMSWSPCEDGLSEARTTGKAYVGRMDGQVYRWLGGWIGGGREGKKGGRMKGRKGERKEV